MSSNHTIVPTERFASQIYLIRGENVMLDADLAGLYGVETGHLVRAMKRNQDRFPEEFAFQTTEDEMENLRCQNGISSWGGRRYSPWAYTEHGVVMLSAVLRSEQATRISLAIVRTFVKLRRTLATNDELARKVAQHDEEIGVLFEHVQVLFEPPEPKPRKRIGFQHAGV